MLPWSVVNYIEDKEINENVMRKLIVLLFLFVIFCSFMINHKLILLENFMIGNHTYSIYKEEKYIHDDNMNAEFFVVYLKNKRNSLCSSFMSAKLNDTIFTRGSYKYDQKKLEFKEYYFHQNYRTLDSVIKIFYPNKNGDLILRENVEFKKAIATKNMYNR